MSASGDRFDAIVIGGGPAGSAIGRLLAEWGHRVVIAARRRDPGRGLAESIPPSARKVLHVVGVLDAIERAGFVRNRGNVAWWGDQARTEDFGEGASGFQVYRPQFDALMLEQAARAGADVRHGWTARSIELSTDAGVHVDIEQGGLRAVLHGRFVVDASGRTGILARRGYRTYQPRHVMQALIGTWRYRGGIDTAVVDRTIIETYEDGWAWSLPVAEAVRQVAVMIDGATTRRLRGATIADTYRAELGKTQQLRSVVAGASLESAWACDASMHSAGTFAGPEFLLVGDAATCIDPLSSFGVKKALASAWLGAIALHTAIVDADRRAMAFDFYAARERDVYAAELARTEAFAQQALARHPHPFWAVRGAQPQPAPLADHVDHLLRGPAVRAAHARLRAMAAPALKWRADLRMLRAPRVHGHEIVLDEALPIGGRPVRFASDVDLVGVGRVAVTHDSVPAMFDAYQRTHGVVELPAFVTALSLLLAEGVIE